MDVRIIATAVCLLTGVAIACSAESPPAPATGAARALELISRLGSDEFVDRESATEELLRIGLPAMAPLKEAALLPDLELRFRAERILGTIRELDRERRLKAFLAGKEEGEYPLPAWNRFKKSYGDERASREFFVELQRADGELMQALETSPQSGANLLFARTQQHQLLQRTGMQPLSLGQIAGWLFVASEEDVVLQTQAHSMVYSACHQQALREALNDPKRKKIPRQMLGTMIRRSEDWAAYNAMILAISYDLDDGLVPALKILKGGGSAPHMSQYALMTVARFGNKSHLPLVEKLLEDPGVVTQLQQDMVQWKVQVRDAALAAAILLTGHDLKSYFSGRPEPTGTNLQLIFFNPRLIGFESDEKRAEVFKKWFEYKAQK